MRRDCCETECGAGYAVLECSPSPADWAELVEAACDVSYSVLIDLLGKFVLGSLVALYPSAPVPQLVLVVDPALRSFFSP